MRYQFRPQIEEDFNNKFNILLTTSEIYAFLTIMVPLPNSLNITYQRRDWIRIGSECRIDQSELVAPFFFWEAFLTKKGYHVLESGL
jgi:hypothetical protein